MRRRSTGRRALAPPARRYPGAMAPYTIRVFGDPVLKQRATEITDIDGALARLADDMFDTHVRGPRRRPGRPPGRRAEAAVRLRHRRRADGHRQPRHHRVPGRMGLRGGLPVGPRPQLGDRAAQGGPPDAATTSTATRSQIEADELEARVFQHELDHLDGVLLLEHLDDDQRKEAQKALRELALAVPEPVAPAGTRDRSEPRRRALTRPPPRLPRHPGGGGGAAAGPARGRARHPARGEPGRQAPRPGPGWRRARSRRPRSSSVCRSPTGSTTSSTSAPSSGWSSPSAGSSGPTCSTPCRWSTCTSRCCRGGGAPRRSSGRSWPATRDRCGPDGRRGGPRHRRRPAESELDIGPDETAAELRARLVDVGTAPAASTRCKPVWARPPPGRRADLRRQDRARRAAPRLGAPGRRAAPARARGRRVDDLPGQAAEGVAQPLVGREPPVSWTGRPRRERARRAPRSGRLRTPGRAARAARGAARGEGRRTPARGRRGLHPAPGPASGSARGAAAARPARSPPTPSCASTAMAPTPTSCCPPARSQPAGRRDRAFVTELVYGATRMRRSCDWLVDRFLPATPTRQPGRAAARRLPARLPRHARPRRR